MPSEAYTQLIAAVEPGFADPADDFRTVRRKMAPLHGHALPPDLVSDAGELDGVPVVTVARRGQLDHPRTLLFMHGGAFVSCGAAEYTFYAEYMLRHIDCRVVIPDYRLAPEHRFPAAIDDCLNCYRHLLQSHPPSRIALIGDSCGGGLAIATLVAARDRGLAQPACAVSISGWLDLEASGDSATAPAGVDPFIDPAWLRNRAIDYLGAGADFRHPWASPLHADPTGLAPLLLQHGQIDITRSDGSRFAESAGRAGVAVTLQVWPAMVHGWQGLVNAGIPEAVAAWRAIGQFVDSHLAK